MMPLIPVVVAAFVGAAILAFVVYYLLPALRIRRRLVLLADAVQARHAEAGVPDPDTLAPLFAGPPLAHLWSEYRDTLHRRGPEVRATVPAEVYFAPQALVDTPLHVEFFKHLPGMLTGVGIIGTFLGLIDGLQHFQPTEDAALVRSSLSALLHAVHDAFLASTFAIGAAMLVTFVEKLALNTAYRELERLTHAIDSLYPVRMGEEYLSDLVTSTEQNADRIGAAVAAGMGGALDRLAQVVEDISERQARLAETSVERLVTGFVQSFETRFGERLEQILRETASLMTEQRRQTEALVGELATSAREQRDWLAQELTQAHSAAAEREQRLASGLGAFLKRFETVQQTLAEQTAAREAAHAARVDAALAGFLTRLGAQQQALHGDWGQLRAGIGDAATAIAAAACGMQDHSGALAEQSAQLATTLAHGGHAIEMSTTALADTAQRVRAAGEALARAVVGVVGTSDEQARSAAVLKSVQGDLASIVSGIGLVVRQEESSRKQLLELHSENRREIVQLTELTRAQQAQLRKLLDASIDEFGLAVAASLRRARAEFDQSLGNSVTVLSTAMDELGSIVHMKPRRV